MVFTQAQSKLICLIIICMSSCVLKLTYFTIWLFVVKALFMTWHLHRTVDLFYSKLFCWQGFAQKYPDIRMEQLINVILCRGDTSRSDAKQVSCLGVYCIVPWRFQSNWCQVGELSGSVMYCKDTSRSDAKQVSGQGVLYIAEIPFDLMPSKWVVRECYVFCSLKNLKMLARSTWTCYSHSRMI